MIRKIIFTSIVALSTILFLGASCTSSTNTSSSSPNTSSTTPVVTPSSSEVVISNNSFGPQEITISRGATVKWTNNDAVAHTVTSDNGKFESGQITQGKTFQFTFNDTGTFTYHCSVHPSMTGKIIVK